MVYPVYSVIFLSWQRELEHAVNYMNFATLKSANAYYPQVVSDVLGNKLVTNNSALILVTSFWIVQNRNLKSFVFQKIRKLLCLISCMEKISLNILILNYFLLSLLSFWSLPMFSYNEISATERFSDDDVINTTY